MAVIGAFFVPITGLILFIGILVGLDLLTGLIRAYHEGRAFSFVMILKSPLKFFVYVGLIMLGQGAHDVFNLGDIDTAKLILMGLTLWESQSIDNNLKVIMGFSPLGRFIEIIQGKFKHERSQ